MIVMSEIPLTSVAVIPVNDGNRRQTVQCVAIFEYLPYHLRITRDNSVHYLAGFLIALRFVYVELLRMDELRREELLRRHAARVVFGYFKYLLGAFHRVRVPLFFFERVSAIFIFSTELTLIPSELYILVYCRTNRIHIEVTLVRLRYFCVKIQIHAM